MPGGRGYEGGRTRMGTKVLLNVYDLTPANDYLYGIGFGLHHSGVEILGSEYSFASGGGIFESTPKEAPGARFRETVELGSFEGGSHELRTAIDKLKDEFGPDSYNLIRRNCNHFANALVWALLGRQIPAHVNRLADIGMCFSCLFPKKMLEEAPVGPNAKGGGSSGGAGFQVYPGRGRGASTSATPNAVFSGSGMTLGSSESSSGRLTNSLLGANGKKGKDDLTDRRDKARMAALARLERDAENGESARN